MDKVLSGGGGAASRPLAPVEGKTFWMNHEDTRCCFYESNHVMSHMQAGVW